jgi:thymidylate synthase
MADPYLAGDTLDDLLRRVIRAVGDSGAPIQPTKGPAKELRGYLLQLTNPRARLSRTATRGKLFSGLGELCWYLAQSNDTDFITYYIPAYVDNDEGGHIHGGYGPRLFNRRGLNQVAKAIDILTRKPDSRQAVIQLFEAEDVARDHKDVPCTCTLQLMVRGGALQAMVYMRSNDVYLGLPHDIFCFTMLQEMIASALHVGVGDYRHAVGSLHLYDSDAANAQAYLNEGWQSTTMMPDMPSGDPWPAIKDLLAIESSLRTTGIFDRAILGRMDPYWADLARLLTAFRAKRDSDVSGMKEAREALVDERYQLFVDAFIPA